MSFVNDRQRCGMMETRRTLGLSSDGAPGFPDGVYR
jgi:hypothetical protein